MAQGTQGGHQVAVLLLLLLLAAAAPPALSSLTFSNSGYEQLLLAVADSVPEDPALLHQLQAMFTSASAFLHTATQGKAYFRSVKILVPKNWTRQAGWTSRQDESFESADVRVDSGSPLHGDRPYTFQPGQCGEPGRYIHLTPKFVANATWREETFGDGGRLLVHEFAHLRYGVFDEYGFGDERYPYFYLDDRREVRATSCVAGILGRFVHMYTGGPCLTDSATKLPDKNCTFLPDVSSNTVRASIMFQQAVASIDQFCQQSLNPEFRHNRNAPNQHNAMCGRRSTSEVIAEHADFQSGGSPARPPTADTSPSFSVLQEEAKPQPSDDSDCGRRGVLVMDLSGSMTTNDRMMRQRQTGAAIINALPRGSRLALVTFSTNAHTLQNFKDIDSDSDRNFLKNKLPSEATGSTAIGKGLLRAIELLQQDGGTSSEDHIFLTTDGSENEDPRVHQILDRLVTSGVHIHTLAYSDAAADVLSTVSQQTKGKYYFFDESANSTALSSVVSVLANIMNKCGDKEVKVELERVALAVGTGRAVQEKAVLVDSSIGRNMVFTFVLSAQLEVQVRVISPSGQVYDKDSTEYQHDKTLRLVTVTIPNAEAGQWKYEVSSSSAVPGQLVSTVQTQAQVGEEPIALTAWMGDLFANPSTGNYSVIYAHVHKGYSPVLFADVTAKVSRPSGGPVLLPLKDDGLVPDNREGDGVYTAYFTQYDGNSRYGLDVEMQSTSRTRLLLSHPSQSSALPIVPIPPPAVVLEPVENVTRTTTGGAFDVTGVTGGDQVPPGPVTDLVVSSVDSGQRQVTLAWTAPGDDLNTGTVELTDLRVGSSYAHLTDNFTSALPVNDSMLLNGSLAPIPAGQRHQVTVDLSGSFPWSGETFVFGLVAEDEVGQTSGLSNLVVATFAPVTFPQNTGPPVAKVVPVVKDTASEDEVQDKADNKTGSEPHQVPAPETTTDTGAMVGAIVGGMLALAIVISVAVLLYAKYKAKKQQQADIVNPFPDNQLEDCPREKFVPLEPAV